MFRRRNPRIQQQQLSYVDVLDVIGAIMNDTESSYDNMTADQLTSSALGTLMLRRIDLTDIYFRAPEADESYRQEIQEAVDFVDENTNIIRRFRNIIRQRGRGLTVRDLREIYGEQERQREEAAAAKKAEEEAAAAKKAEEERR